MKIIDLIAALEEIKAEYGNLTVAEELPLGFMATATSVRQASGTLLQADDVDRVLPQPTGQMIQGGLERVDVPGRQLH